MLLFVIAISICAIWLIAHWMNIIKDSKSISFSGPFPVPVFGNGHLFLGNSRNFMLALSEISNTYGTFSRFYILSSRYLLLTDPKYIEALTSSNELITKGRSYEFLHPWLGLGLLTSSGQRWKSHRKFLTPAFHFNILKNFYSIFLKNNKTLVEKFKKFSDGRDIDLFSIIPFVALDNVTESVMGVSYNAQIDTESQYVKCIEKITEIMAMRMRNPFLAVDAIFNLMPSKKIHDEYIKILKKHTTNVINTRRDELERHNIKHLEIVNEHGTKNKHAFLDLLLLSDIDGVKIDDESVREEVDTFMFEGHDTTTSGIVYALYNISKYPKVQQKILEEQRIILNGEKRDPTYSEIQQFKYLDMVIKESMRLFPPVPLIERMIKSDTVLLDKKIPKNTAILMNLLHMQRDPNIFKDPLEFKPERFECSLENPFTYLVFSAGPRNCIGQKFAMIEMKAIISALIENFELLPSAIVEPILSSDLILRSSNGVHIKVKPR